MKFFYIELLLILLSQDLQKINQNYFYIIIILLL